VIIFGTRGRSKTVGHLTMQCPVCGVTCAQALRDGRRYFTLFFIPVIPFSHTAALVCSSCGQGRKIDKATAEQMKQYLAGHAIGAGAGSGPAQGHPSVSWSAPPAISPSVPASLPPDPGWAPPPSGSRPASPDPGMPMPDPPVGQPDTGVPIPDPAVAPPPHDPGMPVPDPPPL
jgi:hypothetical protein